VMKMTASHFSNILLENKRVRTPVPQFHKQDG
jgi:hypothetical protein